MASYSSDGHSSVECSIAGNQETGYSDSEFHSWKGGSVMDQEAMDREDGRQNSEFTLARTFSQRSSGQPPLPFSFTGSSSRQAALVESDFPRKTQSHNRRSEQRNQMRREARSAEVKAYTEMRLAHANGVHAKYPIRTTVDGEIVGGRTKWHSAVRAATTHILDWSVREYRKYPKAWKSGLKSIQAELDKQFTFVTPVREGYLAEYVSDFMSNDRYQWKKFWTESGGGQHESCPEEAFSVFDKYWRSEEGREESDKMKERRSRVGKRSRSVGGTPGGCSSFHTMSPDEREKYPSSPHIAPRCFLDHDTIAGSFARPTETEDVRWSPEGTPNHNRVSLWNNQTRLDAEWREEMECRMDQVWNEIKTTRCDISELLRCVKKQSNFPSSSKDGQAETLVNGERNTRPSASLETFDSEPNHWATKQNTSKTPSALTTTTVILSDQEGMEIGRGHKSSARSKSYDIAPENNFCTPNLPTALDVRDSTASPMESLSEMQIQVQPSAKLHSSDRSGELQNSGNTSSTFDEFLKVACPAYSEMFPVTERPTVPNLRHKRNLAANGCGVTPPLFVAISNSNNAHPTNKLIWILHPDHGDVPVAQGKSGVNWKSKSKLGELCNEGEQWIFIYRVFKPQVTVLFAGSGSDSRVLEGALPPSTGRHKCIKWQCRFMSTFKC